MKKQRNLRYPISILAFFLIISTVMVTSSPFQMLSDVTPSMKAPLSFKFANAADDKANGADQQEDVKAEESDKDFDQTSFEELGGGDKSADVDQEAQTETDQEATNAEDVGQEAQTQTAQTATGANIGQEAQQQAEQQAIGNEIDQETQQQSEQEATGTGAIQQIQHKAEQLGVGTDVAQQLAQEASQLGIGENVGQEIQQRAKQLGVGTDVAQQLAQTASQNTIGNVQQDIEQQAQQQAFGADIEQKISQTATQIAQSTEDLGIEASSDVQQTIKQIATQSALGGGDVNQIINQISTQIGNNPNSDLAKSLSNLAGLYGSGNYDQYNKALKQIGTQIAIGNNIDQTIIQIGEINYYNYFNNEIKYDIDYYNKYYKHYHYNDDDDDDDIKIIKKIYKRDNTCPTQSDSTQLKGKILGKGVIVLADFDPCQLKDGRATLNIPTNPNLKFVALSIDKKGNNNEGAIITKQKIQSLNKNSGLYVVYFDDKMIGKNPVTGKKIVLDKINGIALYNTSTKSINFQSGNSLGMTAVLKK